MRAKRAVILGCGPAGLFAAVAAADAGYNVSIYSRLRKSEMFGAQYLHASIPGLLIDEPPRAVIYSLVGSVDDYRRKVYGPDGNANLDVSPANLAGNHLAWDIRAAYDMAWKWMADRITDVDVTTEWLASPPWGAKDKVIWSIPTRKLCAAGHNFSSIDVWAKGDAPERGESCPIAVDPFTVVCNGEPSPGWYRASNVFGYRTAEWPFHSKPPLGAVARLVKPISTNCDCWTGKNILRVGRYGRWEKGELSHQAYERVAQWLG